MNPDELRVRFAAATERHLTGPLVDGIELRHVGANEHRPYVEALWAGLDVELNLELAPLIAAEESARHLALEALLGSRLEHHILMVAGDEIVGAFLGMQGERGVYNMLNTVIRAGHHCRGLYRAFLPRVVAAARDTGFREIVSRHGAANNAILVPKLKSGFVISGFELSPGHGVMVVLRLFLNDGIRQVFEYRVDGSHAEQLRAFGLKLP